MGGACQARAATGHDGGGIAKVLGIASITLGVIALLIFPLIAGFLGIVAGIVAERKGSSLGKIGIIVSFIGMFAGAIAGRMLSAGM